MKKQLILLFTGMALVASSALAQSIDVTTSGVSVDADLVVTGATDTAGLTTTGLTVSGDSNTTGTATVGGLVVGTSTILNEGYFESAEQQFPGSNATLTVPHGMSAMPRFTTVSLRCISPEFGWNTGDEIMVSSIHMRSDNTGITVGVNSANFTLRQCGNVSVHRLDANGIANITTSKWRVVLRAWR